MNERIKELYEQVDLLGNFTPTKVPGHYAGIIKTENIEKFAELIVRECAEIGFDSVNAGHNTDYLKNHVYNNILNNFGVDE